MPVNLIHGPDGPFQLFFNHNLYLYNVWCVKVRIVIVHYGAVGEDDAVLLGNSVLAMNVPEKVRQWMN